MSNPFLTAAKNGDLKYIKSLSFKPRLFRYKATDINLVDENGRTALWWACSHNHVEVVQYLVQSGASVNQADHNKETPLWISSIYGQFENVSVLLHAGADPNLAKDKTTPLFSAAAKNHLKVCELLLKTLGILVDVISSGGVTALWVASQNGHYQVVQLLLDHGADPKISKTDNRLTALHMAAQNAHLNVVTILLQHGADINGLTKSGKTPAHLCAISGNLEVMELLLKHGADVNRKTDKNLTPLDFARKNGHTELVQFLAQYTSEVELDKERAESLQDECSEYQDHSEWVVEDDKHQVHNITEDCKPQNPIYENINRLHEAAPPQQPSKSPLPDKKTSSSTQKVLAFKDEAIPETKSSIITQKILTFEYESIQDAKSSMSIKKPKSFEGEPNSELEDTKEEDVSITEELTGDSKVVSSSDHEPLSGSISSSGGEKNSQTDKMVQEESIIDIEDADYLAARLVACLANRGRQTSLDNYLESSNENDLSDQHLMTLSMKISDIWFNIGIYLSIDCKDLQKLSENTRVTSDMAAFQMLVQWRDSCHGDKQQKKQTLRKAITQVLEMKKLPDNVSNLLL